MQREEGSGWRSLSMRSVRPGGRGASGRPPGNVRLVLYLGQVATSATKLFDRVRIRETRVVELDLHSVPRLGDGASLRRIRASRRCSRGWVMFLNTGAACQNHPMGYPRSSVDRVRAHGPVADLGGLRSTSLSRVRTSRRRSVVRRCARSWNTALQHFLVCLDQVVVPSTGLSVCMQKAVAL